MPNERRFFLGQTSADELNRIEMFMGEEHLVVPVVALVEGVLHSSNSASPELALADEFAKIPEGWNGRPVVVNHPQLNGMSVSANIPEVLETEEIGQLFNTSRDGTKLKTEAWINLTRTKALGDKIEDTVTRLQAEEVVEVSTGLFSEVDPQRGRFNNEPFSGIWKNVVPDHLAILSDAKGACSIEDGCGAPRINEQIFTISPIFASSRTDTPVIVYEDSKYGEQGRKALAAICNNLVENKERSDVDTRGAIQASLDEADDFRWVVAVFSSHFIFSTWDGLFQQNFSISDDGSVSLGDEVTRVRSETEFVPVRTNELEERMVTVAELIANKDTTFTDDDAEWLGNLDESHLEKLVPKELEAAPEPAPEPAPVPVPVPEVVAEITTEEFIQSAPLAVQNVLNEGIRMQEARRVFLVTNILASDKNSFTEVELKVFSTEQLEKMASMAEVQDYTAQDVSRARENALNDAPPPPPLTFPMN